MLKSLRLTLSAIEPRQWIGAGIALGAVGIIGSLFFLEYLYGYWKPEPEIVYFQSWEADRSVEDARGVQMEERRIREQTEALADQLAAEAREGLDTSPAATEAPPE